MVGQNVFTSNHRSSRPYSKELRDYKYKTLLTSSLLSRHRIIKELKRIPVCQENW